MRPSSLRCAPAARAIFVAVLLQAVPLTSAFAAVLDYVFDLRSGQLMAYEVEFEVPHPGHLTVEVDWSPSRVVSLRLRGPGPFAPVLRRSGPPPLRLEVDVDEGTAVTAGPWVLSIRSLPARSDADGTITIHLPELSAPPEPTAGTAAGTEPVRAAASDPWTLARQVPDDASEPWARLFRTTERFRALLLDSAEPERDAYRWQMPLLKYLAAVLDRWPATEEALPDLATRKMLSRLASVVRSLEELRLSADPILTGPPPRDPGQERVWESLRRSRMAPVVRELDALLNDVHGGHAPELQTEEWVPRFVSCVTACERYFDERIRLGDERASHREVAETQWDRVLAAAEALASLAELPGS